tara:strand:+ start:493 stop:738 length:246 start_codon:yes stop_codon:yes gene_type:complete
MQPKALKKYWAEKNKANKAMPRELTPSEKSAESATHIMNQLNARNQKKKDQDKNAVIRDAPRDGIPFAYMKNGKHYSKGKP